ncbi:hypothetical protein DLD82_02460 [Methanospirillum stamsii]|uniref:CARDB domain-containing protein n=2 Tax=Methanospirillum stamsii TaxID=1277351 RepID=A0A2V2NK00_9EURY|nr:hypothetical protein DLD82_02460 [Methanospirillum stamsii]
MERSNKKRTFLLKKQIFLKNNSRRTTTCLISLLILTMLLFQVVCAVETNETIDAAGRVTVTNVNIEPSVLMTGDVGLVTFTVENTGSSNVIISDAHLISKDIVVLNSDVYSSSRTIGAGTDMKFTFTILADQPENIYYPAFYLNFRDAGSLRYNIPVRVEEPQMAVSISNIPEVFSKGVTSKISLMIGNAKSVNMTGITILPSGDGVKFNRTSAFIGDLPAHSEKAIHFEITPESESELKFDIGYTCGMNAHETSYSIPITLGTDKQAADPVINNVEITSGSSGNVIAGDVSNAGISDAYGVMVALESAAGEDGNPNQKYVIGTITTGDYSSFELTVPQTLKSIPLVILYKDASGNQFSKKVTVNSDQTGNGNNNGNSLSGMNGAPGGFPEGGTPPSGATPTGGGTTSSGSSARNGGVNPMNPLSGMGSGMNSLPIMEIIYGLIIVIVIVVAWYIWKKKGRGRNNQTSSK